jgi:MFS family permease
MHTPSDSSHPPATAAPTALPQAAIAVLLGTLLLRLAGGLATSSLSLLLKAKGYEGAEVGLVAGAYYATELILAPVFGALSDRIGRKILVVLAPVVGALALLLYPLASIIPLFLFVRALEGISAAGAIPATLGYLSDLTDGSPHRARIMGLYEIVTLVGVAIGAIAVGPIVYGAIGNAVFPILAVVYLLGAAVFWFGLPNIGVRIEKRRTLKDYLRALGNKRLLRFMPAWMSATAVIGLWLVHVQNQLFASKSQPVSGQALAGALKAGDISLYLGLFALAFLAGLYVWGSLVRSGRRTTPMLYAGYGLLLLALSFYNLNHPGEWLALGLPNLVWYPLLLVGGFFQAGFTPVALAYLADISEDFPEDRGVVVGLYSIFLAGGNLIGGAIGGLFVDSLYVDGIVLLTALFTLVALGSTLFIRRVSSD